LLRRLQQYLKKKTTQTQAMDTILCCFHSRKLWQFKRCFEQRSLLASVVMYVASNWQNTFVICLEKYHLYITLNFILKLQEKKEK